MKVFEFIASNYVTFFVVLLAAYTFAEVIVRLTPTKSDDTILEKIGKVLKAAMDFLKIPNNLK